MTQLPPLSTGAWYEERQLVLEVPSSWRVRTHAPDTGDPLSDEEIAAAIRQPSGRSLRELALDARSVAVIVDDLTRPTPAERLLPPLLAELGEAGVARDRVTIILGTGTHGPASSDAVRRKLGDTARGCRIAGHDDRGPSVALGRTSSGSHVAIDPVVAAADRVVAIGGVYPQNTAAFGGGAKAILGVLARRSIEDLHFGHGTDDGRYQIDNDFRRDLEEMAQLARLSFSISVLVDQHRRIVAIAAGDHRTYYRQMVEEAMRRYAAPPAGDADVVLANAYPMDVSATFARSKGIIPLLHAQRGASRILLAACPEGVGHHGLFPLQPPAGLRADLRALRRQLRYAPRSVPGLVAARLMRRFRRSAQASAPSHNPVIWFVTAPGAAASLAALPSIRVLDDWDRVLDEVEREQGRREGLSVAVYPSAPLQVMAGAGGGE